MGCILCKDYLGKLYFSHPNFATAANSDRYPPIFSHVGICKWCSLLETLSRILRRTSRRQLQYRMLPIVQKYSSTGWVTALMSDTPHIYPFIIFETYCRCGGVSNSGRERGNHVFRMIPVKWGSKELA